MHVAADQTAAPAAIHTDLGAIFVSLELSKSTSQEAGSTAFESTAR